MILFNYDFFFFQVLVYAQNKGFATRGMPTLGLLRHHNQFCFYFETHIEFYL